MRGIVSLEKGGRMEQLQFVFSKKLSWRLSRHLCFWVCWYLFQVYLYAFTPSPMLLKVSLGSRLLQSAVEGLFYLVPHMFLSYALMYFVIPVMIIPAKYFKATLTVIALLFITAAMSALVSLTIIEHIRRLYYAYYGSVASTTPLEVQIFLAFIGGLRGGITIGGLAASIKLMKYFYEKQQLALLLEQQKTIAELQSLKAQLHPHFLFNTLNNIYAYTQDTAPVAADMVMGLSSLLRYILYSCNAPQVPLSKEMSMILEYIELEKKRYGNQLEISLQIPNDYQQLTIAPLLILPFVENCFKHGASDMLEHPWINMHLTLEEDVMHLKLVNGKSKEKKLTTGGIGIDNVRRRLQLLYPGKHQLSILEEAEVYIVNLQVSLLAPETPALHKQNAHELTHI